MVKYYSREIKFRGFNVVRDFLKNLKTIYSRNLASEQSYLFPFMKIKKKKFNLLETFLPEKKVERKRIEVNPVDKIISIKD